MSKFNAKNLTFSREQPAFLQAMRDQLTGDDQGPDPILAGRRRAAKKRSASEEAEDRPLVVDEQGHALGSITVAKDGQVSRGNTNTVATLDYEQDESKELETVAFGAGKKRRVGRVVGSGTGTKEGRENESNLKREAGPERLEPRAANNKSADSTRRKGTREQGNKKRKTKVPLSFEDGEEDN